MRTLRSGRGASELAKAIGEVGRVAKTMYLLHYMDDAAYRRRILVQLNRGESRHSLARAVFHGRKGEIYQRYREGMEEQLSALGLVVNAIVLWNTLYMDKAVNQLQQNGLPLNPEDVARLSPLIHEHINLLGRYEFNPEQVPPGRALRPLREPSAFDSLVD
jgi:TnpA family transposase